MNIFQRAWHNLNLSPGERATLKAAEGILVTALVAALTAAASYLGTNGQSVNWQTVAQLAGGAFLLTLWIAVKKYLSAQTDAPLSQPNDSKQPAAPDATPAPAPAPAPEPAPAPLA